MALSRATKFNLRATATYLAGTENGGGYNAERNPVSGVNYALDNTAILTSTTLSTSANGLIVTGEGFTQAMPGNLIYITGGGATQKRYEIVEWISSTKIKVDSNCGLSKTNVTGVVGGAASGFTDKFFDEGFDDGMTVFVSGGTQYNLGETVTAPALGSSRPGFIVGYNSTYGVQATGDDRPVMYCSGYNLTLGTYTWVSGVIFKCGDATANVAGDMFVNCKFIGDRTRPDQQVAPAYADMINCEITHTYPNYGTSHYGNSAGTDPRGPLLLGCYIHGMLNGPHMYGGGIDTTSPGWDVFATIIAHCPDGTGLALRSNVGCSALVMQSDIVNCNTALYLGTSTERVTFMNNIVSDCERVVFCNWGTKDDPIVWGNNFYGYDQIADSQVNENQLMSRAVSGTTYNNPLFTDASGGNFSLLLSSPCLTGGWSPSLIDGS